MAKLNILIAPDKFKGSCTALQVGEAIAKGIKNVMKDANIKVIPLADGGEGTLETLASSLGAIWRTVATVDPLGRALETSYLYVQDTKTAIIEMARASGYELLLPNELNCMSTSSRGTGLQVIEALKHGAKEIVITVGGTATNDGGIGIANALGFRFLDSEGKDLDPIGKNLFRIAKIDSSNSMLNQYPCQFKIATDVQNPFYGKEGAAYVFARQKGANAEEIEQLDKGLKHFCNVLVDANYPSPQVTLGSGAGGGAAGGLYSLLGADISSAADWILDISAMEQEIQKADIIITGEGRVDHQTWNGKLIARLLNLVKNADKKAIIVCGKLQDASAVPDDLPIKHIGAIMDKPITEAFAMANAVQLLEEQGVLVGRLLLHE